MFAQRRPVVVLTEDATAPQFRDDQRHEIIEAGGYGWEHDIETVGGARLQPQLHRVSDLVSRPDDFEPAETTHQLAN